MADMTGAASAEAVVRAIAGLGTDHEALAAAMTAGYEMTARAVPGVPAAAAPGADTDTAARMLLAAERPVLAVESAGRDPEAFAALVDLADLLAIPVVEPRSACFSNFPRTHDLHAGGDLRSIAAYADLVILLGCRAPWEPPGARLTDGQVLVIDEDPQEARKVLTAADAYVGGATAPTLRAITARISELGTDADAVATRRETWWALHSRYDGHTRKPKETEALQQAGPAGPIAVVAALREAAGNQAAFVDASGAHSHIVAQYLMADTPGRYLRVPGDLSRGLGVTLGAKLALGDRLTVLVVGDEAWSSSPVQQGLTASSRHGLPLLVAIFNSHGSQLDPAAITPAVGAAGFTVATTPELVPVLEKAVGTVRSGQTAVVDVHLAW